MPRDVQHTPRRIVRRARDGTFYWRLLGGNNRVVCSGHGYNTYRAAFHAARRAPAIMADSLFKASRPSDQAALWERV